jgi:ferredoxin-NADP reductase
LIDVTLTSIEQQAERIALLTFRPDPHISLPVASAGAHISISLPDGLERTYSLVNAPGQAKEYAVAINLDEAGRGGSLYLCKTARPGDRFRISAPANRFGLLEDAAESVLIAGGIGITPLWSMIQRLEQLKRPWRLFYAARQRASAAFLAQLEALEKEAAGRVCLAIGDDASYLRLDIKTIVESTPASSHLYCCGPETMLASFKAATSGRDPLTVHWEHFSAAELGPPSGGYTVELARSKRCFFVPAGRTTLDVLIEEGFDVAYGCKQGICGACEIEVLAGTPDHRDMVLSDEERTSNQSMIICCSGCIGDRLTLDL